MRFLDCVLSLLSFGGMIYLANMGIWMEVPLWWFGVFALIYGMIWCISSLLMLYRPTAIYGAAIAIAGKPRSKQKDKKINSKEDLNGKQKRNRIGRFEMFNFINRIILAMFLIWVAFSIFLISGTDDKNNSLVLAWLLLCLFVVLRTRIGFDYIYGFIYGFKNGASQWKNKQ